MANNKIIVKRTTTSGRQPNTTASYATNSQYIGAGELALNMADGILYSSNGSAVIEIGANNTNVNISGNLTIKGIIANGSIGTAGQTLTSNGSVVYWAAAGAGSGTVMSRQNFTGDGVTTSFTISGGYTANQIDVYVNGVKMLNGTDVTVTSGTSIVFAIAPPSGSNIETVSFTLDTLTTETGAYYKGGSATVGLPSNANNIFRINGQTLYYNTTIGNTENAHCTGPLTVATGITLSVNSGGRIVIA